ITLSITPEIGKDDKTITINPMTIDITSVSGPALLPGAAPPTNERRATSIISAQDGQTLVIGGLVRDTDRKGEQKVPVLGDLPLLGFLFRSTTVTKAKIELLVFLTPH